jgi:hypothetical protein
MGIIQQVFVETYQVWARNSLFKKLNVPALIVAEENSPTA